MKARLNACLGAELKRNPQCGAISDAYGLAATSREAAHGGTRVKGWISTPLKLERPSSVGFSSGGNSADSLPN